MPKAAKCNLVLLAYLTYPYKTRQRAERNDVIAGGYGAGSVQVGETPGRSQLHLDWLVPADEPYQHAGDSRVFVSSVHYVSGHRSILVAHQGKADECWHAYCRMSDVQ